MQEFKHYTVMLNEAVNALECDGSDKIFVDATLGGGGHSELILKKISKDGRLISFDVDIDAINASKERLKDYKNLTIIHDSYTNIKENLLKLGIEKITGGIIYDLGASYHQLTTSMRGFSFTKDAPLDMRFDVNSRFNAWDVVNKYKENQLETLSEFCKENYVLEKAYSNAGDLKYIKQFEEVIENEYRTPSDDFVRYLISKSRVCDGSITD